MPELNFKLHPATKVCSKCREEKALSAFNKHPNGKEGRCSECRICATERVRATRRLDPRRHMLSAAKYRAKRDNVPFDLVFTDIEIPETCPVLGIPLKMGEGKHTSNSPTLDKIIPAEGYVLGNIVVVSHKANSIKRDATSEELRLVAEFYADS